MPAPHRLTWFAIGLATTLGSLGLFFVLNLLVWPPWCPRLAYTLGGGNHLDVRFAPALDTAQVIVLVSRPQDVDAVVFADGKPRDMPMQYGEYRFTLQCGAAAWVVGGHFNFGRWNFHRYRIACEPDGPDAVVCDFTARGEYPTHTAVRLVGPAVACLRAMRS